MKTLYYTIQTLYLIRILRKVNLNFQALIRNPPHVTTHLHRVDLAHRVCILSRQLQNDDNSSTEARSGYGF